MTLSSNPVVLGLNRTRAAIERCSRCEMGTFHIQGYTVSVPLDPL